MKLCQKLFNNSAAKPLNPCARPIQISLCQKHTVFTHADHVKRWPLIGSVARCRDLSHSDPPSDLGLPFSSFYFELTRRTALE